MVSWIFICFGLDVISSFIDVILVHTVILVRFLSTMDLIQ